MKKWGLSLVVISLLSACSSNGNEQQTNSNQGSLNERLEFMPLASGGVNLPTAQDTYRLPTINSNQQAVDIRPPAVPVASIYNSQAKLEAGKASITYSEQQAHIYNLNQIEQVLNAQGIATQVNGTTLTTDWVTTGWSDDKEAEIRYQIQQQVGKNNRTLSLSVLEMRQDGVIYSPTSAEKQRYAADRLNQLIAELTQAYNQQMQQQANVPMESFRSTLGKDLNGRDALIMQTSFLQAWYKLAEVLPQIGFEIKEETIGRGQREVKYSFNQQQWESLGLNAPDLKNDTYFMQLNVQPKQLALVITDEDGKALADPQSQMLYQSLADLLAR